MYDPYDELLSYYNIIDPLIHFQQSLSFTTFRLLSITLPSMLICE